jgi:uncharacterized protein YecA (UPF0149 family)
VDFIKRLTLHTPPKIKCPHQAGRHIIEEAMKVMGTEEKGGEKESMKPGRNDPCFCGSGLKFKKCHGK